jgi:capsular polysaccharide biosynthesis protein
MEKEGYRPATVRSAVEALKSVTSSYLMQPNVLRGIVIAMVAAVVAFLIIQRRILDHTIGRLRQIIRQRSRRQENSET